MENIGRKISRLTMPLLGAGAVGVCPLCWAGSAALLSFLGLGALIPIWIGVVFLFLGLGLLGFILDYRYHKTILPSILYIIGGILLYLGRYVFGGIPFGGWQIWGPGSILVILAILYNKKIFSRNKKGKRYQCQRCGFHYTKKEWAKKCEAWCKKHKSCNLDITKHSIEDKQ